MRITVTQEDVDNAYRELACNTRRSKCCPISQAIRRAVGHDNVITCIVGCDVAGVEYSLPESAERAIVEFDLVGRFPLPLEFELA